ncbi:hypothetical protein [Arenimonas composti]|uniref:hypothetical protein n=1 Tax=Arenimonas composti TaxID=370776 RepID=UPI000429AEC0|nr:hypothetical protein [Arenimonas composti]
MSGWIVAFALLAAGAAVYWLSSRPAVFEHWFRLPQPSALGLDHPRLVAVADAIRRWFPDLCWSVFAGVAARDLAWATFRRVDLVVVVFAAMSWELGQLVLGHRGYAHSDLAISFLGGVLAFAWPGETAKESET